MELLPIAYSILYYNTNHHYICHGMVRQFHLELREEKNHYYVIVLESPSIRTLLERLHSILSINHFTALPTDVVRANM